MSGLWCDGEDGVTHGGDLPTILHLATQQIKTKRDYDTPAKLALEGEKPALLSETLQQHPFQGQIGNNPDKLP